MTVFVVTYEPNKSILAAFRFSHLAYDFIERSTMSNLYTVTKLELDHPEIEPIKS